MKDLIDEFRKNYDSYEIINSVGRDTWQIKLKNYNKIAILKKVANRQVYEKLQSLKITGVPTIYDIFSKDGCDYVIEEFINGSSLKDVIISKGSINKQEVKNIMLKLCDILDNVHGTDIIHRDIKPSNIIIASNNEVYLIDFGIARYKSQKSFKDTRLLGTEYYASPEQYGFAQTDNRSDIYSLGRLMIVLLTGREEKENIKGIPYYRIISKCIQVDSSKRYGNVKKLKMAFNSKQKYVYIAAAIILAAIAVVILLQGKSNDNDYSNKDVLEKNITQAINNTQEETTEEAKDMTAEATTLLQKKKPQLNLNQSSEGEKASQSDTGAQSAEYPLSEPKKETQEQNDSFESDTLYYQSKSDFGHLYYDGISPQENPYAEIGDYSPKQVNNINLGSGKTAKVYTEQTSEGLKITINNRSILCPNTNNVAHTPLENTAPNGRLHTAVFYDFNGDGIRDIFVAELAYYIGENADKSSKLYMAGHFVKINPDLTMSILEGDKLICQGGNDSITIRYDMVLTENTLGYTFVNYKVENDRIVKYIGML